MSHHPGTSATGPSRIGSGGSGATREAPAEREEIDRPVILASVARDARLNRKFLLLIVLSAAIATLGLLQNSAAVVIGAMLVSPLLGPIMGIGFGLATLESQLIRRSLITLAAGIAAAILVAVAIVWLTPVSDVTAELRGRTQPTLLDLGIAVVGGVAGVYAILRKLSGVMVGVAIATALVPPLGTIGFGLATGRPDFALGAALLFLTNTLAIAFAATLVARLNRFGPSLTPRHTALQLVGIVVTLGVLSVPLAYSLNTIAREFAVRSAVQSGLDGLLGSNDRIDELTVELGEAAVRVDGVILVDRYRPTLSSDLAAALRQRLDRTVSANLVQLRQQTEGAQNRDAFERRLAALERRDEESARVLASLQTGGTIARSAITLDPQLRRAIVARPTAPTDTAPTDTAPGEAPAEPDPFDAVLARAQAANPGWLIAPASPVPPATN